MLKAKGTSIIDFLIISPVVLDTNRQAYITPPIQQPKIDHKRVGKKFFLFTKMGTTNGNTTHITLNLKVRPPRTIFNIS